MEVLRSADGAMKGGAYKLTPGRWDFSNGYPLDEIVVIVKGSVVLKGADGKVFRAHSGQALAVAKGWKGSWETSEETTYFYGYYSTPKAATKVE